MAVFDGYPVSRGHMLIIPKSHRTTFFDMTLEEKVDVLHCIDKCKEMLDDMYHPSGYNIGVNVGSDGGQSVMHAHVHVIPRYHGDVPNPLGGVRGVIPNKQQYGEIS